MSKKEIVNNSVATVRVSEPVGEAVETVESLAQEVLELSESVLENVENAVDTVRVVTRNNPWVIAGVATVALGTGLYVGYRYGFRKAGLIFDERLAEELEATRNFYAQTKTGRFATPESAAQELVPQAAQALKSYRAPEDGTIMTETVQSVVTEETPLPPAVEEERELTTNVFTEAREGLTAWDYVSELQARQLLPDGYPYVISQAEFNENEGGYNQDHYTWFEGDSTLVDNQDMPIDGVAELVGDDNLERFGHGSGDNNIVYVRNDALSVDLEIVRHSDSYAKKVHGFDPEIAGSLNRAPRRMRSADM